MEDLPASAVLSGRIFVGLYPATMWLANFPLSLWDEAAVLKIAQPFKAGWTRMEINSPVRDERKVLPSLTD